mmetsp:Transcript_45035/g.134405  ORF Transcript_45035/g.134405 Transcript_45035/m.134405 type:complete len:212 (-) Transcript_45035:929-1564(-)
MPLPHCLAPRRVAHRRQACSRRFGRCWRPQAPAATSTRQWRRLRRQSRQARCRRSRSTRMSLRWSCCSGARRRSRLRRQRRTRPLPAARRRQRSAAHRCRRRSASRRGRPSLAVLAAAALVEGWRSASPLVLPSTHGAQPTCAGCCCERLCPCGVSAHVASLPILRLQILRLCPFGVSAHVAFLPMCSSLPMWRVRVPPLLVHVYAVRRAH